MPEIEIVEAELDRPEHQDAVLELTEAVNSNYIQYPETRIQDQSTLTIVFIAAAKLDFKVLCNKSET